MTRRTPRPARLAPWLALAALAAGPRAAPPAAAAGLPETLLDGRLRLGGSAVATVAPDDDGFFNYTSYEVDALRRVRLAGQAEARLAPWLALVGEVRTESFEDVRLHAAFARLRPFAGRPIDVQAGRIPPVFGAYGRSAYGPDETLPGSPLGYQYLTTLRTDAVPLSADALVARRGQGWQVRYLVGSREPGPGLPLASGDRYDAGIEGQAVAGPFTVSAALTQGTLASPRVRDDNGGKQLAARLAWRASPGFALGVSGARGEYLARSATAALPAAARGRDYRQHALGLDLDWARGHAALRAEAIWSRFDVPVLEEPFLEPALDALAAWIEGRYKAAPGVTLAVRAGKLGFEEIATSRGRLEWDAPVVRFEAGGSVALGRDLELKAACQWNERDAGPRHSSLVPSLELGYWF